MLVLGVVVDLITGAPASSVIVLFVVGMIACAVATLLTYKRWLSGYVMYISSAIITVLTLLLIFTGPIITTYFLVYVNLAVMTLYGSSRSIAFSGLTGIGMTIYLFMSPYKEEMFGNNDPITIFLYLLLIAVPLYASAIFSERLQREVTSQSEQAIREKNRAQAIVDRVSASLGALNDFSANLKTNVTSTSAISKEVTSAFSEVTASIETQTSSITNISDSIHHIEQGVTALAAGSTELRSLSESSVELTEAGNEEAEVLEQQMSQVLVAISTNLPAS